MFINAIKIHNFRNLKNTVYRFNNKVNIFHGENGVGKTSVLEAIYYLSTGKSFRKCSFKSLINFDEEILTVYIETKDSTIAVSKNKQGLWQAKKNSNSIAKQSLITNLFPVVSIDPEVYRLVDFGPIFRRNFLDWLVFHVKHEYLLLWKKTHKCIKQLNILYKNKAPSAELDLWESNLICFSEELNNTRQDIFNKITPTIKKLSVYMQEEILDLTISFKQGWSESLSFKQQLEKDRSKNILFGKLQHGPQKMDIIIKTGTHPASQTLSRGQKKILSISFYMAYVEFLHQNQVQPIICLDDFDAELDESKLSKAADFFNNINSQLFITSVQPEKIKKVFPEAEMFHVEH